MTLLHHFKVSLKSSLCYVRFPFAYLSFASSRKKIAGNMQIGLHGMFKMIGLLAIDEKYIMRILVMDAVKTFRLCHFRINWTLSF